MKRGASDSLRNASPDWRGRVMPVLALLALAVLAGCDTLAGGAHPFAKEAVSGNSWVSTPEQAPRVSITSFSGLPPGKDEVFLGALMAAAAKRDVAVVPEDPRPGTYVMAGRVDARRSGDGVVVSWSWRIAETGGGREETITGQEALPGARGGKDPWDGVDNTALSRVAAHVAENLTGYFGKLGYSTQIAGLPPPAETFQRAGPDAAKDIDPDMLGPLEAAAMIGEPGYPETPEALEAVRQHAAASAEPPKRPKKTGGTAIRDVAITGVTGSPGPGNDELAAAMKQVISGAGWPVVDKPGPHTLRITGRVTLGAPRGASQPVSLAWTVRDPGNVLLGTVKQNNAVPAGALDKGWGQNASFAAQAAASGIFDLVEKVR